MNCICAVSEQQEAGDDGDEDEENELGQMDAETMSLPLPHVTAAMERPPTLSAASSTATLASRHRHASQQSFADESNLLAVTQQQGSRRGSVQLLKAFIEQQHQQQHLGQGQLQSTSTVAAAADVIGSDPLTHPQPSPSRSTADQLLDGDVLVMSLQQAKSSQSKQQLNAESSTDMRGEELSTEPVLTPPPSHYVPQSRADSIVPTGKTSVTRPTNYVS